MEEKRTTTSGPRILEKLEIAPHSINTVPYLFSIFQCSINSLLKEIHRRNIAGQFMPLVLHNNQMSVCEHCSIQRQLLGNGEGHSMERITGILDGGIASKYQQLQGFSSFLPVCYPQTRRHFSKIELHFHPNPSSLHSLESDFLSPLSFNL